ncbi:MAG: universal stress protein [Betaproteobacteria bacterium]|nr:universal stress protein [Betaproteobacteria bacterium]
MGYKSILVHMDNSARAAARLEIAVRLARQHDAHLVGLHTLSVFSLPSYALAEAGNSILDFQRRSAGESAQRAEAQFKKAAEGEGLPSVEWRQSFDDVLEAVALHARYVDLIVLGQTDPADDGGVAPEFPAMLTLAAGRPVLIIPYVGKFDALGKRALVAWNASRESTRAVTDAIPMLKLADTVNVVAFNPRSPDHGQVPGADIGLYLARHGLRVEVSHYRAEDIDAGNQLLSRAADLGSDLIVMGAYGHSRLRETVMGGVTRTILESMTVPVLMSH